MGGGLYVKIFLITVSEGGRRPETGEADALGTVIDREGVGRGRGEDAEVRCRLPLPH